ncbi:MAG: PQQ-binding-like beta-propeller repeat protein [Polyangiales bacterium]
MLAGCGTRTALLAPDISIVADSALDGASPLDAPTTLDGAPADVSSDALVQDADTADGSQLDSSDADLLPDVAPTPVNSAVAYQIDPGHSGSQPTGKLTLPLKQKWLRELGGQTSYALVVSGRVFVTVGQSDGTAGVSVVALDERTGATLWGPTEITGPNPIFLASLAYEAGRVFAAAANGQMWAFDAVTGDVAWRVALPGEPLPLPYGFSPPVALGGQVYVGQDGTDGAALLAVRESDGALLWMGKTTNGVDGAPAAGPEGIFVSYACAEANAFDRFGGTLLWNYVGTCGVSGQGPQTSVLYGGAYFARGPSGNVVLDATTGAKIGDFASDRVPAFSEGVGYYVSDGIVRTLNAIPVGGTTDLWTWTWTTDELYYTTAPIVVGEHVIIGGASGKLYVLRAKDGVVESTDMLPSIAPPEYLDGPQLAGLTFGDDILFVPTNTGIAAY